MSMPSSISLPRVTPARFSHPRPVAGAAPAACARVATLYALHFLPLCAFLRKRMGASDEVLDIAQQTFCEALLAYSTFRGQSAVRTWLYGIALNIMRNHLARARRDGLQPLLPEALEVADPHQVPTDEALSSRERLRNVAQLLSGCSACSRDALLMVAVDGLSYEEAAQRLQVAEGTVRSRVSRLRAELRCALESGANPQGAHSVPPCVAQCAATSAASGVAPTAARRRIAG